MKIASSSNNDVVQVYSNPSYPSSFVKQLSSHQKSYGLGFGFNSPKNETQKMITLSTRVTTEINRSPVRFDKTNQIYELKSSKLSLDSPSKIISGAPITSTAKAETPQNLGHIRNNSQGNYSEKKKSSNSTTTSSNSKQQTSYKRSTSQVLQANTKVEQAHSRKLKISTEPETDLLVPAPKTRSTRDQYATDGTSSGSTRINKVNRRVIEGPVRLLTASNTTDWQTEPIAIGQKMQTAPNEDRVETSVRVSKSNKYEIYQKPNRGADFFGTYSTNREQSRDKSSDQAKEKNISSGNRKIGFSSNGQLQYTSRGQGVIKSNTFFTNGTNSWFSSVSATKDKTPTQLLKYDYKISKANENSPRPVSTEKRVLNKQGTLQRSTKSISERSEAQNLKSSSYRSATENDEEIFTKEKEKENKTPSKEVSLQSFVTKVNKGDIIGKKSVNESKYQRSGSKSISADKTPNKGSELANGIVSVSSRGYSSNVTGQEEDLVVPAQIVKSERTGESDKKSFIYYMTNLEKYHREFNESDYFCQIYREHFIQSFQAMVFCRYLKPADPKVLSQKKVILPKRETHKDKKTLIFDLDETLIHCNESTDVPSDIILPIKFPHGEVIEAGINIRPYAKEILKELSQIYEIIVFTASHSCYANVILDYLDPDRRYIHHRLFREHCMATEEGVYVKDLRVLGNRSMQNMIIVDNAAYSFGYQISNGIPIIPYYDNKNDQELKHLIPYLKFLNSTKDPREINKITFKLHAYSQYNSSENALESLVFQE